MRNFKEDLVSTMEQNNISRKQLTFPLTFKKEFRNERIEIMQLSVRAGNSLKRGNIFTIGALLERFDTLSKLRNCGASTVKEIKKAFMQAWYESLESEEVDEFWKEFIKENK